MNAAQLSGASERDATSGPAARSMNVTIYDADDFSAPRRPWRRRGRSLCLGRVWRVVRVRRR